MEQGKRKRRRKPPLTIRKYQKYTRERNIRERYNKLKGSGSTSLSTRSNLEGSSSLHQACKNGDSAKVSELIESVTGDVNKVDLCGYIPLHHAIANVYYSSMMDSNSQGVVTDDLEENLEMESTTDEPTRDHAMDTREMDNKQRDRQRTELLILEDHAIDGRDMDKEQPLILSDTSMKSWEDNSQKTTSSTEVTFDSLCQRLIDLLPVLKEPYKKDTTVLSSLVTFLEQIQGGTILPDHLPFLLFCDSVSLRAARTRNENPPKPHYECNLFHALGVKLMGPQFGKYMTGDRESLFHFLSLSGIAFFKHKMGIETVSKPDQLPTMLNADVEELRESPTLLNHDARNNGKIMNTSINDEEVLMKKIKKEVTSVDWTVENIKVEEPVPELFFEEYPNVKEERKPLFKNTELYYKDDVKDQMKMILKLEEVKDSVPENREDNDTQNSFSVSTKSITPEEYNIEENVDSEHATFQNANTGEKSFSGDKCSYCSSRKDNIKIHDQCNKRRKKPYSCDKCSYRSSRKSNLKVHQHKHTGDHDYSCDKCSFCTVYRWNWKRHQLRVH